MEYDKRHIDRNLLSQRSFCCRQNILVDNSQSDLLLSDKGNNKKTKQNKTTNKTIFNLNSCCHITNYTMTLKNNANSKGEIYNLQLNVVLV